MSECRFLWLNSGPYSARIDLHSGANCIALRHRGYDARLLREPEDPARPDNPYLCGMPILFPANRISGGGFSFDGRQYCFGVNEPATGCHLHGTLHSCRFEPVEEQADSLHCVFQARQGEYLNFPHSFAIHIRYRLSRKGLEQHIQIENLSQTAMPVLLGFHTTFFACFAGGDRQDILVKVPIEQEYQRDATTYLPTGRTPAFDAVSRQLNCGSFSPFCQPISRHYLAQKGSMVIYDQGKDLSLVYETDEKMPYRLIYNGSADGYICLEPQTCLVDCANLPQDREKHGFFWILPGKDVQFLNRISIMEGDQR